MASRREADRLIAAGAVLVNGRRPPATGLLVDPERDSVTVQGREVAPARGHRYLVLNKPVGVVVSTAGGGRPTVFDLAREHTAGHRLFAVGRLDVDTSGLLLLTDDGDLSNRLLHPSRKVPKEYEALVAGLPGERDLRRLRAGVELEDGLTLPAEAEVLGRARDGSTLVRLVLTEGRNRQVRRMLEAVGHPVRQLRRTAFGPVRLGRLREGDLRRLREPEVRALSEAAGR